MRVRPFLLPLALLALPVGAVVGCGGRHHSGGECSETITANGEDNSVYAGDYTATFVPDDGSARNTLTVKFHAPGNGFVQGAVSDPGSASGSVPLGSNSLVAKGRCDGGKTYFRLFFQRSVDTVQGVPELLSAKVDTLTTLAGASVRADLNTTNAGNTATADVPGTLTVSTATTQ